MTTLKQCNVTMSSILLITIICIFLNSQVNARLDSPLDVDNYPYLVHIADLRNGKWCSGTIISPNWILTSATCLTDTDTETNKTYNASCKDFNVIPVTSLKSKRETQYLCPSYFLVHANFNSTTYENDIAMMKLAHPINTTYARPIHLANETDFLNSLEKKGKLFYFLRGYSSPESEQNRQLYFEERLINAINENNVTVIDSETCKKKLAAVTEDQDVCSLYIPDDANNCIGDFGPLLVNNIQIGVTSFGIKCNSSAEGVVHTRVDKHLNWIRNQISPLEWEPHQYRSADADVPDTATLIHSSITLLLLLVSVYCLIV